MKNTLLAACLFLATLGGRPSNAAGPVATPETTITGWPKTAKLTAKVMIEKYGKPNGFSAKSLIWLNNGPWKRTVVYRDGWLDKSSTLHPEVLEQVITYWVPRDRIIVLERFDDRFTVDSPRDELSFRSESERLDFLAMNLANEVVSGSKSVEQAQTYFTEATRLAEAGKISPYTDGFVFEVKNDPNPIQN